MCDEVKGGKPSEEEKMQEEMEYYVRLGHQALLEELGSEEKVREYMKQNKEETGKWLKKVLKEQEEQKDKGDIPPR